MAGSTVTISKVAFNRIPAVARALGSDADKVVRKTAFDLQGEVIAQMEGPKTGRWYRIPGTKGRHKASAPGQAPARLFGLLAGSVGVQTFYQRAVVFMATKYAPHLEYGTRNMAARPVLRPAAKKYQRIFDYAVRVMVERAVSGR